MRLGERFAMLGRLRLRLIPSKALGLIVDLNTRELHTRAKS